MILPVVLSVAGELKVNPIPFIIPATFASNVCGTATPIGDPPNIMIGGQAGLDFVSFLISDQTIAFSILVGVIEETGVISMVDKGVIAMTGRDVFLTAMAILWVSAIASANIDNIPFVATMIPLILQLGSMYHINVFPLWWHYP